jgi:hypothetical protein
MAIAIVIVVVVVVVVEPIKEGVVFTLPLIMAFYLAF